MSTELKEYYNYSVRTRNNELYQLAATSVIDAAQAVGRQLTDDVVVEVKQIKRICGYHCQVI